ncbi:C45 family autoproteolytic acyltransferase/hydolase [Noviherbaspirillum agri]
MKCISLKGAPFEIGEALGRLGKPAARFIQKTLDKGVGVVPDGKSMAEEQMVRVQERFPDYWEELRGLSAGLGLPVRDVFLWNCWPDIAAQGQETSSTVAINRLGYRLVLYSPRLGPPLGGDCVLVDVLPDGKPGYLSLYVPGRLPGTTFAVSRAGVVHVVNAMAGERAQMGLPTFITGRAVLDAASFADAIDIVMGEDSLGAAHYVFASAQEFIMLGISATPKERQIEPIPNKHWHTNHLVRKDGAEGGAAWQASHQRYLALGRMMAGLPSHPAEEDMLGILERNCADTAPACEDAAHILPAEGEIGTVLIKVQQQRIELNLFLPAQGGKQRHVVAVR